MHSLLFAVALTVGAPRPVVTFGGNFNNATSFVAQDGHVVMPDSQTDAVIIQPLDGVSAARRVPTVRNAFYVAKVDDATVVVSDTMNRELSFVDWRRGRELSRRTLRDTYAPWQMTVVDGVVWGSERSTMTMTRFDVARGRELPAVQVGSGPTKAVVLGRTMYLVEEGAYLYPADDYLALIDLDTAAVADRFHVPGNIRDAIVVGDRVCLSVAQREVVLCGVDGNAGWSQTAVAPEPAALAWGAGHLFVLSRGGLDEGDEVVQALAPEGDGWREVLRQPVGAAEGLVNARHLGFDAATSTLLVRGDGGIVAFPVTP